MVEINRDVSLGSWEITDFSGKESILRKAFDPISKRELENSLFIVTMGEGEILRLQLKDKLLEMLR